jgi:5-methylcytosine-specific restriction endonuclease McrA
METKICSKCGIEKPVEEFPYRIRKDRGGKFYYSQPCKQCKRDCDNKRNRMPEVKRHRNEYMKGYVRKSKPKEICPSCEIFPKRCKITGELFIARNEKELYCRAWMKKSYKKKRIDKLMPSKKIYYCKCEITGKWFISRSRNRRISNDGYMLYNLKRDRRAEYKKHRGKILLKYKLKRLSDYKPQKIKCKFCGKEFIKEYGDKRNVYCCYGCAREAHKKKNLSPRGRAQYYGVKYKPINKIKIFERDKWKCQQCGAETPQKLKGTFFDNAPELDHVIPISKGGDHVESNLQLLCRKCNIEKGDKIYEYKNVV